MFIVYSSCSLSPFFFLSRHFNLRMKRDTTLFSPDLIIEVSGEEEPVDTSHIYSGEVFGKIKSSRHVLGAAYFMALTLCYSTLAI